MGLDLGGMQQSTRTEETEFTLAGWTATVTQDKGVSVERPNLKPWWLRYRWLIWRTYANRWLNSEKHAKRIKIHKNPAKTTCKTAKEKNMSLQIITKL